MNIYQSSTYRKDLKIFSIGITLVDVHLKGSVCYILASLYCKSKREQALAKQGKMFFISLESFFYS